MAEKVSFLDKILTKIDSPQAEAVRAYTTGLLQDKQRLEEALDRTEEGLILIDLRGTVLWANRRAFFYLGFPSYSMEKTRLVDLVNEPFLKEFFSNSLQQSAVSITEEFNVLHPREMSLRLNWIPLEPKGQKVILLKIENITEERGKGEEQARAERTEGLTRLASGIAHEIGNPLNSIQIHLALLNREVSTLAQVKKKKLSEMINVISSETRRLDEIIRDFLKATRRPPLRYKKDSVNDILDGVLKILRPEIIKVKVKIKASLEKRIPEFLMDRDRIHEAFVNLIKNAIEAMPGGGLLKVGVEGDDEEITFVVTDTGSGIAKENMDKLFTPFFTTKEMGKGTGLGLALIYGIVKMHKGKIHVDSNDDASRGQTGTTFRITIPRGRNG